jgi:hypothetical protein
LFSAYTAKAILHRLASTSTAAPRSRRGHATCRTSLRKNEVHAGRRALQSGRASPDRGTETRAACALPTRIRSHCFRRTAPHGGRALSQRRVIETADRGTSCLVVRGYTRLDRLTECSGDSPTGSADAAAKPSQVSVGQAPLPVQRNIPMDDPNNDRTPRFVLWGLLALMAVAGFVLLATVFLGSGLEGGPS